MSEQLSKHTLNLREGDYEFLKDRFPKQGAAIIVRRIVSNFVDKIDKPLTKKELKELE